MLKTAEHIFLGRRHATSCTRLNSVIRGFVHLFLINLGFYKQEVRNFSQLQSTWDFCQTGWLFFLFHFEKSFPMGFQVQYMAFRKVKRAV